MELEGLRRVLNFIKEQGLTVGVLVTDRLTSGYVSNILK